MYISYLVKDFCLEYLKKFNNVRTKVNLNVNKNTSPRKINGWQKMHTKSLRVKIQLKMTMRY